MDSSKRERQAQRDQAQDHYAVLQVGPAATAAELKAAYHAASRTAHPDRGGSEAQQKAVNLAYEVLSDVERRAAFDRRRAAARTSPQAGPVPPFDKDAVDEIMKEAAEIGREVLLEGLRAGGKRLIGLIRGKT